MKADMFSLIQWNEHLEEAPPGENLLIIYKDDSGDYINYYTQVAWYIRSTKYWISNDDIICIGNIIAWARFPKYEEMKVFK